MAYEEALTGINQIAGADLSAAANIYTAVKLSATGVIKTTAAGEACLGIIQGTPKLGDPVKVAIGGVSKAKTGAAVTIGAYVTTRADGTIGPAATGNRVIGTALAAAASGDIIPVLIAPGATAAAP